MIIKILNLIFEFNIFIILAKLAKRNYSHKIIGTLYGYSPEFYKNNFRDIGLNDMRRSVDEITRPQKLSTHRKLTTCLSL